MNTARHRWALLLGLLAVTVPACRREAESVPLVIDARDKTAAPSPIAPVPAAAAPPAAAAVAPQPAAPGAAPPAAPAAPVAPAAVAAPLAAPAPAAAATAAAVDGSGEYATVELSGAIELPPGAQPKERLVVFIASGDCLNDAVPLLRRLPVTDNRAFFAAVMVPQGSTLSLCAAAEPAPGQPAHLYGRAGTLPIQKAADQTFRDVTITLREDSPRRFATQIVR